MSEIFDIWRNSAISLYQYLLQSLADGPQKTANRDYLSLTSVTSSVNSWTFSSYHW